MGNVYLGVHTLIGRRVAIKALNPVLAQNPEIRARFKHEASTLSHLHHTNIVQLYDYVETEAGVFLVMEYAEGQALDEYIARVSGPIPEDKALALFGKILDGVAYAHKQNVVHRDIKPSNIIVSPEGKVKILDFGIAKIIGDTSHKLTKTGVKLGTVLYMSPEQVKGQDLDYRTDIYSLGISLFEILTGKCPFDETSTEYEVYKKIVEEPLPDPRTVYPAVSEHMVSVIMKATAKNPAERFLSCAEFRKALMGEESMTHMVGAAGRKVVSTLGKTAAGVVRRRNYMTVRFWNILMGLVLLSAVTVTALKLFFLKEERYVIANELYLRSTKSNEERNNRLTLMKFGDRLQVMEVDLQPDEKGFIWARVADESGHEGYVALNYLGSYNEYTRISRIFDGEGLQGASVLYKRAVLNYYGDHDLWAGSDQPLWVLNSVNAGGRYSAAVEGDFNTDGLKDYACVLVEENSGDCRVLGFIAKGKFESQLVLEEDLVYNGQLALLKKGDSYATGRTRTVTETDEEGNEVTVEQPVFRTVESDALIVKDKDSGRRQLFVFDRSLNRFNKGVKMP